VRSAIGRNFPRIDGREKVTGTAIYATDLRVPGMLHGGVLRSPVPHARVRRIDAGRARSMPGVAAVLTRENIPVKSPFFGGIFKDQGIVAVDKVRYVGDIVAAVAATEKEIAEEAVKRIDVEYEDLPAVLSLDEALRDNAPLVHEKLHGRKKPQYGRGGTDIRHEGTNICLHFRYEHGDIGQGFASADAVFEETFLFPGAQHYPMEPHLCIVAFEGDGVTVWTSTQSPFLVRQDISELFEIRLDNVRVIVPYLGGGYGGKDGTHAEALAAALARLAGRPVRLALTAEETFKTVCQPGAKVTIKTGVKKDGTFVARCCQVYLEGGAYADAGPSVVEKAGYRAHGPYRIPHVLTDAYHVYTNTVPAGAFRGFGTPQVAFAYESHMETISRGLGIDSLDFRMKNLIGMGQEYSPGDKPLDSDLKAALAELGREIEWGKKTPAPRSGRKTGKGIACVVKNAGGTNKPANAMVKISDDGTVILFAGSVEMGQGIRTALLQIVAEEFATRPEDVQIAPIDTREIPFDKGTNASSAVTVMGQAVQAACKSARDQLLAAGAPLLGAQPSEIELRDGRLCFHGREITFAVALRGRSGAREQTITGMGHFSLPHNADIALGYASPFWEIGLAAAEIELDEMTGDVRILKYVSVTDAGKMIQPLHCRGQDEGAAVFGIGLSLCEELVYRDGQLINPNLVDYRLPRFRDLPRTFTTRILEQRGGPGPYGAKGMGEGGILAAAPAICNAVYDAIGMRAYQVPLKGERVWRNLRRGAFEKGDGNLA
jgi:CO/xanthine dehydrogenase Mo-binding subunit